MDVIYLDIDSLRPDHVGAYGYDADTTPNIDALAGDAVQFDNAYTANSPCMPSRAALLSGRYGIANGVETHGAPGRTMNMPWTRDGFDGADEDYLTLPELLFEERQTTAAVSSFPRHPAPWFYHLWHEFHQPQEPDGRGEYFQTPRAEDVTDRALDVLDRHDEDVFLYTQYWDPHAPYNRSDDAVDAFRDPPMPPHPTEEAIEDHQDWDAWRGADQMGITDRDDLAELLAGYDAEINYMDEHVGRLLDTLKEEGRYDDALIILTADHGEEFGEHGLYREHWSTHDGTQKVPLLIKPPGNADADVRDQLVTNVDLAPTIADYAGIDIPAGWHGDPLRDVVEADDAEGRDHIVFDHGLYTAQRAVRTPEWKLIRTYHAGMWDGVVPRIQLYDMEDDPWEQDNVADDHADVVEELESRMDDFADTYAPIYGDALRTVAEDTPQGITHIAGEDEWDGV